MNFRTIRRALISVSDKTGLVDFARELRRWNVELISTGGTLRMLIDAGLTARSVSEVTGFAEILDGRVKTLHPIIHAGLLAVTENPDHRRQLEELKIDPIDMVIVNCYPFERTIGQSGTTLDEAIEQIDIGGPTMLRAAAKNYREKTVIASPASYPAIVAEMALNGGAVSEATRFELAKEVFRYTAHYDGVISGFLDNLNSPVKEASLPETFSVRYRKSENLRYGENPHQQAALYGDFWEYFEKLHGKELSYNNIVDIQAAAELVEEFS
jgi:phosphoribosylaminoimidazolecarboxamide formyltransferase / IMP cyclohydrolase